MRRFWKGFAMGTAAGAGGALGSFILGRAIRRSSSRQIVRLDKTLQIGAPVEEVFAAWENFERLPERMPMVRQVRRRGKTSHWQVEVGGRNVEFDSEITQFARNEAIGWKSFAGPKHTGRISFSSLGNDTMIHVVMNYLPAPGVIAELLHPLSGLLDEALEQALRDFKASLEGKGQERAIAERESELRATGTFGGRGTVLSRTPEPPAASEPGMQVEWTRPTEAPSTYSGTPDVPGERKNNLGE